MKITDPQVIEDGEKDLIEAVQEDLDLDAVRQILKDRVEVSSLASKGGQIVVHNNKIAFRLDFDIKLSGSLLFDREGNYIDEAGDDPFLEDEMDQDGFDTPADDKSEDDLDELPLVETGLDETDLEQQDLDEEIIINLPEYGLEDDLESDPGDEIELSDPKDLNIQSQDPEEDDLLSIESDLLAEDTSIESKEADTEELEGLDLEDNNLEDNNLEDLDLENLDLENDALNQEDMLDNDINDILKESREFWDQKKES